jgi:DNA-binding GntR family transcriptional regulator
MNEITQIDAELETVKIKQPANFGAITRKDIDFHHAIAKYSGSSKLIAFAHGLRIITLSFSLTAAVIPEEERLLDEDVYTHQKVISALEARDPGEAESMMRLHIEEGKNQILRRLLGVNIAMHEGRPVRRRNNRAGKGGEE